VPETEETAAVIQLRRFILACCVCLAGTVTAVRAQGTFFLKPYSSENISTDGLLEHQARWLVRTSKPEDLKGVPADLGKRVYYYTGTVGDRDVIAIVESGRTRQLYIDLDGDKDLSNAKPVASKRVRSTMGFGWSQSYRFGPMTFSDLPSPPATSEAAAKDDSADKNEDSAKGNGAEDQDKDENRPRSAGKLTPGSFYAEQFDLDYLLIRPAVCRKGTIRIDDKSFPVVLTDSNFNGRYDDAFKFAITRNKSSQNVVTADFLSIDVNRNGRFDREEYGTSEIQPLTKLIQLQKGYYWLEVAEDGSKITLNAAKPDLGTLDVGKQQVELMVISENGTFYVQGDEKLQLPAGKYRLTNVTLHATDDKKVKWALRGRVPDKKAIEFEITKGNATELKIGPPLAIRTSERVTRSLLSGRVVSFGVSSVDGAGIEYQAGPERGGRQGLPPSVKIVDENDKILSIGQFEYG
jgi:hypothetical protein